jgi:hypothetical protein
LVDFDFLVEFDEVDLVDLSFERGFEKKSLREF